MIYSENISIVIPVLNAEPFLESLLDAFSAQNPLAPKEVVIVDSGSTDKTLEIAEKHDLVKLVKLDNFSHGRARNVGARAAEGDVVVLLTQDALPMDENWLSKLVAPFEDKKVAAVYSRQIPKDDASPMERFFLLKRFPQGKTEKRIKQESESLTFERVFFSNVSAAVRRDLLLKHPFDEDLIMSEDQQLSRDLMNAGHAIVYEPESIVRHSHNYTLSIAFKRYFDSVYSLSLIFSEHDLAVSVKMGREYVMEEIKYMARKHPLWLPYYVLYTLAKSSAAMLAHCADRLPKWILERVSLHSYHWEDKDDKE